MKSNKLSAIDLLVELPASYFPQIHAAFTELFVENARLKQQLEKKEEAGEKAFDAFADVAEKVKRLELENQRLMLGMPASPTINELTADIATIRDELMQALTERDQARRDVEAERLLRHAAEDALGRERQLTQALRGEKAALARQRDLLRQYKAKVQAAVNALANG